MTLTEQRYNLYDQLVCDAMSSRYLEKDSNSAYFNWKEEGANKSTEFNYLFFVGFDYIQTLVITIAH